MLGAKRKAGRSGPSRRKKGEAEIEMPAFGAFVYTSTHDGMFARIGFKEEQIYEVEGDVLHFQVFAQTGCSFHAPRS